MNTREVLVATALSIEYQGTFYHVKDEQEEIPWKKLEQGEKGLSQERRGNNVQ